MVVSGAFWVGIGLIFAALLVCYIRAGGLFNSLVFTAFTGIGALGLLWLVGHLIPIPVKITAFSAAASAAMGIPGVISMLLLHLL